MRIQKSVSSLLVIVLLSLSTISLQAQNRKGQAPNAPGQKGQYRCENFIPDLTDTQKDQLKTMRLELQKEALPLRNEIRELHARLTTLETAEKPDMKAINQVIDKIAEKKKALRKMHAEHKQDVRKILTDEQRIVFDNHQARRGGGKGYGMKGHHKGSKRNCQGQGYGNGPGSCYRGY